MQNDNTRVMGLEPSCHPAPSTRNFRTAFPSAKWDAGARQWVVGPRSGKRLESWIEAVAAKAAEVAQAEAEILTLEESPRISEQAEHVLNGLQRDLQSLQERCGSLAEVQAALKQRRNQVDAAQADCAHRMAVEAEAKADIDVKLGLMCDRDGVLRAAETMRQIQHAAPTSAGRARFNEAQDIVRHEVKRIAEAGFAWAFAGALIDINYNRPYRDRVRIAVVAMPCVPWKKARWHNVRSGVRRQVGPDRLWRRR